MTQMVYDLSSATNASAHWTQLLIDSNYMNEEERQRLVNAWDEYMRILYEVEQRIALEHPTKTSLEDIINEPRKQNKPGTRKGKATKRNPTNG